MFVKGYSFIMMHECTTDAIVHQADHKSVSTPQGCMLHDDKRAQCVKAAEGAHGNLSEWEGSIVTEISSRQLNSTCKGLLSFLLIPTRAYD